MKNTIKHTILLLLAISFIATSCSKDTTDDTPPIDETQNASYELIIDGNTISSNTSIPLGMLLDASDVAVSISVEEAGNLFAMGFTNIPTALGSSTPLSSDDDILIAITGTSIAAYSSYSQVFIDNGTMIRTANDQVTFTGTFEYDGTTYNATGFIKSDGMKNH